MTAPAAAVAARALAPVVLTVATTVVERATGATTLSLYHPIPTNAVQTDPPTYV